MSDVAAQKQALLEQLKDVQLPAVSVVPALGWWLLALLVMVLVWAVLAYKKRQRFTVWQQQVQQELNTIIQESPNRPTSETLMRCSALARKLLLLAEPRELIAPLQGEAWLAKLDEITQQSVFTSGYGRLLLDSPYQANPEVRADDMAELFDAMSLLFKQVKKKGPYQSRGRID